MKKLDLGWDRKYTTETLASDILTEKKLRADSLIGSLLGVRWIIED
jgi:hypothetical protein